MRFRRCKGKHVTCLCVLVAQVYCSSSGIRLYRIRLIIECCPILVFHTLLPSTQQHYTHSQPQAVGTLQYTIQYLHAGDAQRPLVYVPSVNLVWLHKEAGGCHTKKMRDGIPWPKIQNTMLYLLQSCSNPCTAARNHREMNSPYSIVELQSDVDL